MIKVFKRVLPYIVVLTPFFYLDFPWWVELVLIVVLGTVPIIGDVGGAVLWIWGLVQCVSAQQTTATIVYYVLFAIVLLPYLVFTIYYMIDKAKHPWKYN